VLSLLSKTCGHCHQPLPLSVKVGDQCPYCGVRFGAEKTTTTAARRYASSSSSTDELPLEISAPMAVVIGSITAIAAVGAMLRLGFFEPGAFGAHPWLFVLNPLAWALTMALGLFALLGSIGAMREGTFNARSFAGPLFLCVGLFATLQTLGLPLLYWGTGDLLPLQQYLTSGILGFLVFGVWLCALLAALLPAAATCGIAALVAFIRR
jgi:hypothetical protein